MRRISVLAGCIVVIVLLPGFSYGIDLSGLQPPAPYGVFSSMSAQSPEKGKAALGFSYEASLQDSFSRIGSNIAFGLSDRFEVSMSASNQRSDFEDIAVGLKHRFIDKSPRGPSLAFLITSSLDTGRGALGTGGKFGGGLIISEKVGPVYAHFNIFYAVPGHSRFRGEFRSSAGIVFSAAHNVWLLSEAYVKSSHFSKQIDQFETRFGYRTLVSENIYANLGLGIDFKQDPTDYKVLASLAFQYPWKDRKIKRIYEEK
jgi:hypothetical protein